MLAIDLRQVLRLPVVGGFGLRQSKVREAGVDRGSKPVVDLIETNDDVLDDNIFCAVRQLELVRADDMVLLRLGH